MAETPVFVSNPDFRVPRLRQRGERVADRAVQRRKRGRTRGPDQGQGYRGVARLARSGPCAAWVWDPGLRPGACYLVAERCFPCAYGEPESPTSPPTRPRTGAHHKSMTIETSRRASLEFVGVFGQDGLEVPWGQREREDTISFLEPILSDLPEGVDANASRLASPGRRCALCRIRPECRRYIDVAPTLWRDPDIAGHLPLDTLGSIVSLRRTGTVQDIEIRDPNGDLMVVRGLDISRWGDLLQVDGPIHLFGLESTEDRRSHGSLKRPRNFHEFPPDSGQRLRRARSLLIFGGIEGAAASATQAEELN